MEAIKNGKSKDTGNSGHKTKDEDKQAKNHNTETRKDEQRGPHQIMGVNSGALEG
jgi:hypothetical protein